MVRSKREPPRAKFPGEINKFKRRKQGNLALRPYQRVNNQLNILSFVALKASTLAFQATTVFYHFISFIVNQGTIFL